MLLTPDHRVAVLLHGGVNGIDGKTGLALLRYRKGTIVVVIDQDTAGQSLGDLTGIDRSVPIVASVADALAHNPDVLVIGIAPLGGQLPLPWLKEVRQAVAAGLSVVNGLHQLLALDPEIAALLATAAGSPSAPWVWDLRQEPPGLTTATAAARNLSCRRVLTVGTDMAVGKMSTGLELNRLAQDRGLRSRFVATGQAGIMICGEGIPLDAVRVDFAAGSVEAQVLRQGAGADVVWIEGQGSLLHPSSTAPLPLVRGSQPTHLLLVHRAGQAHIYKRPECPIPPLPQVIALYEALASSAGAFTPAPVVGIALNTFGLSVAEAQAALAHTESETGLPCADVVRWGGEVLLDAILQQQQLD
ncbi:DUF1611 domain-containing protein [Prochlorothrix hollandica]|uniref:EBNA-1 nuclear protein n=1 Tax=Prochlorothrix hollandica PCC 9006 = CALU 1027 TaxID=317619 RepID=A0A0M2PV63_PROHO|nr:DUF1611 domain-containing protein [Prochlorothrix hollandica]KKJ00005.1 hypothetical protein PROH_09500 [Prochlorothrix hollandica PCC 9006 = CALU 1027]